MSNRFGWVKPKVEVVHPKLSSIKALVNLPLPVSKDLSNWGPNVYDQQSLGACSSHAGSALAQYLMIKLKRKVYRPSRLDIYYWNRVQEKTVNEDSGASLQDTIFSMANYGLPPEYIDPYDISKFKNPPSAKAVEFAKHVKLGDYYRVGQTLNEMKTSLSIGLPIILGFTVYESFESNKAIQTGIVPMPGANESVLGGHAIMLTGFSDVGFTTKAGVKTGSNYFKFRNSWGTSYGDQGYGFFHYDYMLDKNLTSDLWTATYIMDV